MSLQLRLETDTRVRLQRPGTQARGNTSRGDPFTGSRGTVTDKDYIETLNILVTMQERDRKHHRGHSAQLARQASVVARRLGMAPRDVAAVSIAGYLHDLGKPAERHFCVASNAVNPEWMADAKRYCRVPTKLFESVNLPVQVNTMLAQLYEAYDGSGTPQGAKGDDITLGARILAAVDSYLELTKNPANAHGNLLPEEATRTGLLESTQKQGLVVHALSSLDGAYDALGNQDCDVLVVGLKFGLDEVLGLLQAIRSSPEHAGLPVVVLGDPDAGTRERLMMGGASAVLPPTAPVEAAKTIRVLYEDRIQHNGPARVVRGSLDELPAPQLFKLLAAGKKSGRLYLKQNAHEGYLHLEQGKLIYATVATQNGEQAMQTLLGFQQAEFRYDPDSLLLDTPQMDKDLEVIAQQVAMRRPTMSTPTVQ
jgi:hypothetical protein